MISVDEYLKGSKVTPKHIKDKTTLDGRKLPKRFLFVKLKKYVRNFWQRDTLEPRLIGISGLRGVGKTSLLWQIADYAYNSSWRPDIYYISMDHATLLGLEAKELFNGLLSIINPQKKTILLLDEIHFLEKWDLLVKLLYDNNNNLFIIVTGSSALSLHSSQDLASRWNLFTLFPLSFPEFVMIRSWFKTQKTLFPEKSLGTKIFKALFEASSAQDVFKKLKKLQPTITNYLKRCKNNSIFLKSSNLIDQYIKYHNIPRFITIDDKTDILDRSRDLIDRFIHEDLAKLENISTATVSLIRRVFVQIAFSGTISETTISSTLGIKKADVHSAIETLKKAEFLLSPPLYRGLKSSSDLQRLFFTSPTFRYALARDVMKPDRRKKVLEPLLLEDIVAMYLYRNFRNNSILFVWGNNTAKTPSPDFIIDLTQNVIPIEISVNTKQDVSQLNVKNKLYGIIISKKASTPFIRKNNNIVVPLSWFLLM